MQLVALLNDLFLFLLLFPTPPLRAAGGVAQQPLYGDRSRGRRVRLRACGSGRLQRRAPLSLLGAFFRSILL